MYSLTKVSFVFPVGVILSATAMAQRASDPSDTRPASAAGPPTRELDWNTYLDKVQGAWMGKMIAATFGAPWELQYQGVRPNKVGYAAMASLAEKAVAEALGKN